MTDQLDKRKKRTGSRLKSIVGASVAMMGLSGLPRAADASQCFSGQRFPKVIQGTEETKNAFAGAIAVLGDEAVFAGGFEESKDFRHADATGKHTIVVGRINLSNNMWGWQKNFVTKDMKDIHSLALDPNGAKLAVVTEETKKNESYIFVLDAATGQPLSSVLMIDTGDWRVGNKGLHIDDDNVYMAMNHVGAVADKTSAYEQRLRIGAYNYPNSQIGYMKEQTYGWGKSASLVYGNGSLYLGGSYEEPGGGSEWGLAFVRIGSTAIDVDSKISILHYSDDDSTAGCSATPGFSDTTLALFINNIGYDSTLNKIFGTSKTHDHSGNTQGVDLIIFTVAVDANGDASTTSGDFKAAKISALNNQKEFFGIHPALTVEGGYEWIHCILGQLDQEVWYVRVTPDDSLYSDWTAHRLYSNNFVTYSAGFTQSLTTTIGSGSTAYTGYQSFYGGSMQKYNAFQVNSEEDSGKTSFFVMSVFEDASSCHRATANAMVVQNEAPDDCLTVIVQDISFGDVTVTNSIFTTLEVYNLDTTTAFQQVLCNDGDETITSTGSGTNTISRQCYGYDAIGSVTFDPNTSSSSSGACTDAYWMYSASASTPDFPDDIILAANNLDQPNPSVTWGIKDNSAPGYDVARVTGVYNIDVVGTLQDSSVTTQYAFSFELELTACMPPTVLTAPTPTQASYTYNIGEPSLSIVLDSWSSDESNCSLTIDTPTISPADTEGIFTFSADNLTVTVQTNDYLTAPGPANTYTITTQPSSTCFSIASTSYDVVVVNACATASISIDADESTFPLTVGDIASTYIVIVDDNMILGWNNASDIVSTITWGTDICGEIIQEIVATSADGSTESAIDGTIFHERDMALADPFLLTVDTDVVNVGLHYFRLKVYHQDFSVATLATRDFIVELVLPCLHTTLSIDDTIIRTESAVSLTQYVNYSQVSLHWTDSIIQSTLAVGTVCGTYTHEVQDITSTPAALNTLVFPTSDTSVATSPKFIDAYTTDFSLAGQYRIELKIYFTDWIGGPEATKNFLIDVIDYCEPTSLTKAPNPGDITYTLGRTAETTSFNAWTADPIFCNFVYMMDISPFNPNSMISFDDTTRTVSVVGSDVFYGGDHLTGTYSPGTYTVEIRAWADNSYNTDVRTSFDVIIVDPCDPYNSGANISILSAIFTPNPITTYMILDPVETHTLVADVTTVSETETSANCPTSIRFEVTNRNYSTALDSIFTWTSASQELAILSSNFRDLVNPIRGLRVSAYYQGGSAKTYDVSGYLDFTVELQDPCADPASVTAPSPVTLSNYLYTGAVSPVEYTVADNPFVVDPVVCHPSLDFTCSNVGDRTDLCSLSEDGGQTIGTFDAATFEFSLQTTNMATVRPGTYIVSLVGTVGLKSATVDFTFDLVDPCLTLPTLTIDNEILSGPVSHVFRDPQVVFGWDFATPLASVSGVSVDGNCGDIDIAFFLNDGSETALDVALFTDDRGPPTQFLINYIDDPLKVGTYDVTYKVYLVDYTNWEAFSASSMTVIVIDPCVSPQATIAVSSLLDQEHVVGDVWYTYAITPFIVYESWCQVTYSATWDPLLDSVIAFDPATATFLFQVSSDLSLSGAPDDFVKDYIVTVTGQVDILEATADYTLTMKNLCISLAFNQITHPAGPFQSLSYTVGAEQLLFDFIQISGGGFETTVEVCDDDGIFFSAVLALEDGTEIALDDSNQAVIFEPEGTFKIFSTNTLLIGSHELRFTAHLTAYPDFTTTTDMILPIIFEKCQLAASEWTLNSILLPFDTGIDYQIELPEINFWVEPCDFDWYEYTVQIFDSGDNDVTEVTNDISFDPLLLSFTIGARLYANQVTLRVEITAQLSDLMTNATSSFDIVYEPISPVEIVNTPPYVISGVQDVYLRTRYTVEGSDPTIPIIDPVHLGTIHDQEGDQIFKIFECVNCDDVTFITFDEIENIVKVPSDAPANSYQLFLTLSDDNEDSKTKRYRFRINVSETIVFVQPDVVIAEETGAVNITWTPPSTEELVGKEEPKFKLESLSFMGLLEVSFSQQMIVPYNMTEIDESVLELEVVLDETNDVDDDMSKVAFSWIVESYGAETMTVQIEYETPVYVSTGINKDQMRAKIVNPSFFQSSETFLSIPQNSTDLMKIPKQMSNSAFTRTFADLNGGLGNVAQGTLIGNFLLNLLLSGAMNLLWGLLHAVQIVAHFPLINIMMPPNAQILFQVMVKIATFDMLPTEDFIQSGEETIGLKKDNFIVSDSFVDYGFDSTDPIRNLQVLFLFLLFLLTYPLLQIALRGLCFCSQRCKRCITRLNEVMFWNTYIRFGLEAYLELQIATLLRFKNFSFDGADQIFHTVFSMMLLVATWGFLIFAGVFLMTKFTAIKRPEIEKKFGDLYLGLNIKSRIALFNPVLFMLRRVAYAGIVVFWSDRSYFQVQFLIFKQSLMMLYVGYNRPYYLPSSNLMELINETLTLMCCYSLIMFSAFVPDAQTRFLCGWELVGLVALIVIINLCVITYSSLKRSIWRCKLKKIRRQKMKEHRARMRQQFRMNLAEQATRQDQFYNLGNFGTLAEMVNAQQAQNVELKVTRSQGSMAQKYQTPQPWKYPNMSSISEQVSEESKVYNGLASYSVVEPEKLESLSNYYDDHVDLTTVAQNGFFDPAVQAEAAFIRFGASSTTNKTFGTNGTLGVGGQQKKSQMSSPTPAASQFLSKTPDRPTKKFALDLNSLPKYPIQ